MIDNIALGEFNPDIEKVLYITKELGLRDFIESLPNGLSTMVGEHGATLSGGERQRLAISRALYKNPDILLFDEATSSLDAISEKYVKNALDELIGMNKTIVVIAHRLSTIKDADQIVVISEEGAVEEQGTHNELYANNGLYKQLWNEQFEGVD